jgi:hypothetical protein
MAVRDSRNDMLPSDPIEGGGGPAEAASMISEAVAELAQLSRRHRLDMLAHCSRWRSSKQTSLSASGSPDDLG